MAKLFTFVILCSLLFISATNAATSQKPTLTLKLYIQDAIDGPDRTVWEVAKSTITSSSNTSFGQVRVVDDLITDGPDPKTSKALGRFQGLLTSSDMVELGLTVNMNIVFKAGPYNGSTLCILGRSPIYAETRELVVAGGTGAFKMARGYTVSRTYSFDQRKNYGVIEYNVSLYLF